MTRLFALLPFIMGALATTGSESKDNALSSGGIGAAGGGIESSSSINSAGQEEIQLNIGPVQIKIIGSFSGLGKWQWEGAKPGENSTVHQVSLFIGKHVRVWTDSSTGNCWRCQGWQAGAGI